MKHFPIGFDNFAELVQKHKDNSWHHYFADKSLLIRDILNSDAKVLLFTRPRRFGKTMNMSMLKYFFDVREAAQNKNLFTDLKIAGATIEKENQIEQCMNYQGKYPVIFLTFKSVKASIFDASYGQIKYLISALYSEHRYLSESDRLKPEERKIYGQILNQEATDANYNNAIRELTKYLHQYYNQKVIVLIDEYDTPFQAALYHKYYQQLRDVMEILIGEVLKNEKGYIEKAVLTGILRISGAGIFSGANNVLAKTVLDYDFSEHFGFTESEISQLLSEMNRTDKLEELRNWYNGYQFGDTIIYNPWSTILCIAEHFDFSAHWVNTGNDKLIKELLLKSPANIHQDIAILVSNQPIEVTICKDLRFDDDLQPDEHLWTLLLSAGYLKSIKTILIGSKALCTIEIPNREVSYVYIDIFAGWLKQRLTDAGQSSLIEYLLTGQAEEFGEGLKRFYLQTVSMHDVRDDYIEAFYHGFMVGIVGLSRIRHAVYVYSNRESGLGRYDLVLEPRNLQHPKYNVGVILEFKRTTKVETLVAEAKKGLDQIKNLRYVAELQMRGIHKIIIMGIAFCGKEISYAFERLQEPQATLSTVQLMTQRTDSPISTGVKRKEPELDQKQLQEIESRPDKQQKIEQPSNNNVLSN
jgi:hypothetical protein